MIGKGGRRMATRGFKMGTYVSIKYRDPDRAHSMEPNMHYEGKICDKRVGGQDRESYVELKDCIRINEHGQVIARGDKKRLMDAFIEECEAVEPREDRTPIHEKVPEPDPAMQLQFGGGMSMGQMPMCQMPMATMPMAQMPMQGMQMIPIGQMQGQGMSMVPVQMMPAQGMQGMPMMQQMPMMQMMPMGGQQMQGGQQMMMMPMGGHQMGQGMPMMQMMGGGQPMQGGQQMMMMVPMTQAGSETPAASSDSRARSRSRSR